MKVDINLQDIKENLFRVEMLGWSYASRAHDKFHALTGANRDTYQAINASDNQDDTDSGKQSENSSTSNTHELLHANVKADYGVDFEDDERGDVPGWVLVVLMTTGLVTAIWTIAAPRLSAILKNSLDAMNGIR